LGAAGSYDGVKLPEYKRGGWAAFLSREGSILKIEAAGSSETLVGYPFFKVRDTTSQKTVIFL
jgi:hypothetical protein